MKNIFLFTAAMAVTSIASASVPCDFTWHSEEQYREFCIAAGDTPDSFVISSALDERAAVPQVPKFSGWSAKKNEQLTKEYSTAIEDYQQSMLTNRRRISKAIVEYKAEKGRSHIAGSCPSASVSPCAFYCEL